MLNTGQMYKGEGITCRLIFLAKTHFSKQNVAVYMDLYNGNQVWVMGAKEFEGRFKIQKKR